MDTEFIEAEPGESTTYHLDPSRRKVLQVAVWLTNLVIVLLAVPIGLMLVVALNGQMLLPSVLMVLILIIPLGLLLLMTKYVTTLADSVRIVVSRDGIEYHGGLYIISTSWDNVVRIGQIPSAFGMTEGLVLREPAMHASNWLCWLVRMNRIDHVIPLASFMWWWRDTELGDDIRRYAPHLFEQPK